MNWLPNHLVQMGSMSCFGVFCWIGEYGAMIGAKIATNAAKTITASPAIAARLRKRRHTASRQSERCLRPTRSCWAACLRVLTAVVAIS